MYYLTIYYKIHMVWWGSYSINIKSRLLIGTLENTVFDDFENWSHLDPPTPDSTEVPEASRRFNFTVKQLQRHHAPMLSKGAWWPNRAGQPKKPNAWRFKIHHMTILDNFFQVENKPRLWFLAFMVLGNSPTRCFGCRRWKPTLSFKPWSIIAGWSSSWWGRNHLVWHGNYIAV